jgi:hypothetical protein
MAFDIRRVDLTKLNVRPGCGAAAHELGELRSFPVGFERSRCKLDDGADGVVRSPDRKSIAKIRREDYERTLKRRKK